MDRFPDYRDRSDWGRFPDDAVFETNVREFLDLVRDEYSYAKVFVISPIWRAKADGSLMGERFDKRRKFIEDNAKYVTNLDI